MGVIAYHYHCQPVTGGRLRRLGSGRGSYGLGWRVRLGWRLWWRLERRLGWRLRWRLWWRLGWPFECRLEWLGWRCLRVDVVGLAVLTPI
jgi:hypothetical protein